MKFLEDLSSGDCFKLSEDFFIVTSDFKIGKRCESRSCVNLINGSFRWIASNTIVDFFPIFFFINFLSVRNYYNFVA